MQTSIKVQSPGRINIIGEHTDYNDGFVLPAAIDKYMDMELSLNGSANQVNLHASQLNESYSFDLQHFSPIEGGWQNYLMGVVHELQALGGKIKGFDAKFSGDIPIGGGMSSSAALVCSLAYALNEIFELGFSKIELVQACQRGDHKFVGIRSGIMDQFASMMGKKERVMLLDCRSLEHKYYPLELGDYQVLLLNTNVSHTLASSEYNKRREECETGVSILQQDYPDITHLRDLTLEQLNQHRSALPSSIFQRCHHVVSENQRVMDAVAAMSVGDHNRLGQLLYASHFSLQLDYAVSCAELDFLVQDSLQREYILGSRMMGGGFGGCTINIIEKSKVDTYLDEIAPSYEKQFGRSLSSYSVSIEGGTKTV